MKDFLGNELITGQSIIVCIKKGSEGRGFGKGEVLGFTPKFVKVRCPSTFGVAYPVDRLIAPRYVIGTHSDYTIGVYT